MAEALSRQSLQERLRLREERKQQEELLKAFETPEEKRARRLAKKEAKERKKREKMGWGEEYMGYTNTDNPFGDNNLLGTFIWNKVSPPRRAAPAAGLCVYAPHRPFLPFSSFPFRALSVILVSRDIMQRSGHTCPDRALPQSLSYTHVHTHTALHALPLTSLTSARLENRFSAAHTQGGAPQLDMLRQLRLSPSLR